ncbi:MAG: class I SAM-dependent methyltransferase [Cyanobacteria bacterium P01_E01_bin.6]
MTATKTKPDWAGDDLLSHVVNILIRVKPFYAVMKRQARRVLIQTAEKNGIPWRQSCQSLEASDVKQQLSDIEDTRVSYPDYYRVPFHAYDDGNLCWLAAFEAESATYSMALRIWPYESLTWQTAQQRLRSACYHTMRERLSWPVNDVLDIGCSVGISSQYLHQFLQEQQTQPVHTIGLDLSPQMLSVARFRDAQQLISLWVHAAAEHTGFSDASFDLVSLQFVLHELPRQATQSILREIYRILRPGGLLLILDNDPQSPIIQGLPPALFTLMKSTEPWSDEYYTTDVVDVLKSCGFENITTTATDPRHRTILASVIKK